MSITYSELKMDSCKTDTQFSAKFPIVCKILMLEMKRRNLLHSRDSWLVLVLQYGKYMCLPGERCDCSQNRMGFAGFLSSWNHGINQKYTVLIFPDWSYFAVGAGPVYSEIDTSEIQTVIS
jgi:hypothetical protein